MNQIVIAPAPVLRQPTKPVESLDKRVLLVLQDMEKVLLAAKDPQGVGLAAPQIGVSLRIFMIRPTKNGPVTIFINPEITNFSQAKTKPTGKHGVYEGCLSIPAHYAPVTRSKSVTVKYQTLINDQESRINNKDKNKEKLIIDHWSLILKEESFTGFSAHVIQHEMDHLNGILFIDRVLEQNTKLYKIVGEEWEEVGI